MQFTFHVSSMEMRTISSCKALDLENLLKIIRNKAGVWSVLQNRDMKSLEEQVLCGSQLQDLRQPQQGSKTKFCSDCWYKAFLGGCLFSPTPCIRDWSFWHTFTYFQGACKREAGLPDQNSCNTCSIQKSFTVRPTHFWLWSLPESSRWWW